MFPDGAQQTTNVNDLAAGFAVGALKVPAFYVMSGNAISLAGGFSSVPTGSIIPAGPWIGIPITLAADQSFAGGSFTGTLDMNGHALTWTTPATTIYFAGTFI